jgi:hypothetical protein
MESIIADKQRPADKGSPQHTIYLEGQATAGLERSEGLGV